MYFSARRNTEVPAFLFTAPDASTHIFEFLSDLNLQGFFNTPGVLESSVLNWTDFCSNPSFVFLGYDGFLGCLLYPNVTRNVRDGILPANLSDVGFSPPNTTANAVSREVRSIIPTCLVAYCASQPVCAASSTCNVGNLFTNNYQLSAQGVGECWQSLCSLNVQSVNSDIAGIGILISYLLQSIIALVGLCILVILACVVYYCNRRASACANDPASAKRHDHLLSKTRCQWEIINAILADFHKAQCYIATALQIASAVVVFSNLRATNYNDQNFLLLVSLNGLIPVVLNLYTLMTFGKKSWYMIFLSVITVLLASVTGGYLATHVIRAQGPDDSITSRNAGGGDWPSACGNNAPDTFCSGLGPNMVSYMDSKIAFLSMLPILDATTGLLVLWKVLTDSTTAWDTATRWLANKLAGQQGDYHHVAKKDRSPAYTHHLRRIHSVSRIICHFMAASGILVCLAVEFYYFNAIFKGHFVDFNSWSFGQIVGITTWAAIFIEFAYLEYNGVGEGSDWRFPKWLHVRESSVSTAAKPPTASPPPPEASYNDERKGSLISTITNSPSAPTGSSTETQAIVDNTPQPYSRTLKLERRL